MTYNIKNNVPLDLLETSYLEHLEILRKQIGLRIHLVEIRQTQAKLICSLDGFHEEKDQIRLREALIEVSHKVFSVFQPKIKTPVVLQWELI